jgi:hypothetical protein
MQCKKRKRSWYCNKQRTATSTRRVNWRFSLIPKLCKPCEQIKKINNLHTHTHTHTHRHTHTSLVSEETHLALVGLVGKRRNMHDNPLLFRDVPPILGVRMCASIRMARIKCMHTVGFVSLWCQYDGSIMSVLCQYGARRVCKCHYSLRKCHA